MHVNITLSYKHSSAVACTCPIAGVFCIVDSEHSVGVPVKMRDVFVALIQNPVLCLGYFPAHFLLLKTFCSHVALITMTENCFSETFYHLLRLASYALSMHSSYSAEFCGLLPAVIDQIRRWSGDFTRYRYKMSVV